MPSAVNTVRMTSCLFRLNSAALLMLNYQQFCSFGQIQTSQTVILHPMVSVFCLQAKRNVG